MEGVLSKAYGMQLPASDTCDIYDGQGITYACHLHLDQVGWHGTLYHHYVFSVPSSTALS